MGAEGGVAVWGIETGDGVIRAVRVARRTEGGFEILDFREEEAPGPGPEALVRFLRRRGLRRHPIALAVKSPTAHFRSVRLAEDELVQPRDDPSVCIAEYVHPEPEDLELKWLSVEENLYLISAEERARVETYLIALESAGVTAWSFATGLEALHAGVKRSGLFEGDGTIVRVERSWTDILFLDGDEVARQSLPIGQEEIASPEGPRTFVSDLTRLTDYHRTRRPREEPERIVLLGLPDGTLREIAALLPDPPVPFPEDATPLRAGRRISLQKALEICRRAPAAAGAAFGAVAEPRREELALRPLPLVLPRPPRPAWLWYAASVLLVAAFAAAFAGIEHDLAAFRAALRRPPPIGPRIDRATVRRIEALVAAARLRLALPAALSRTLGALPGPEAAPWRTERLTLSSGPEGSYGVTLSIRLPEADAGSARVEAARKALLAASGVSPEIATADRDTRLTVRFTAEGAP